MAREADSRILPLDGLRGLAILLVLLLHFALWGGVKPADLPARLAYGTMIAGWVGVDLFFVLSGFLITGILYRARGDRNYFRHFYMRRILRIFPLYYVSLVLFLVVLPTIFPDNEQLRVLDARSAWPWLYLTNVQIAAHGWLAPGMLGHFWSLAVEEQFYLLWPVVVLVLPRRALIACCSGVLWISLFYRIALHLDGQTTAAYVLTPARLDALAVGALIALLAHGPHGLDRFAAPARRVALAAGACVLALFVTQHGLPAEGRIVGTVGYSVLAMLFGGILIMTVTGERDSLWVRLLTGSPLVFLGRYSYGLYVLHQPALMLLPPSWSIDAWRPVFGSWIAAYVVFSAFAMTLTMGLALLSWHGLEKHFLRMKVRYPYQATPASPVRSPGAGCAA